MSWLAFYNKEGVGDVLLLTCGPIDGDQVIYESKDNITLIKDQVTNEIKGINLFEVADTLNLEGNGHLQLSKEQVDRINGWLHAHTDVTVTVDNTEKFVVGYVEACKKHEDSDHLSVTQVRISDQESLQIVCGAKNIRQGLHVIVALPGAVMPSGSIIWPGELRGVKSVGMICSTRELDLRHIEDLPGIWEVNKPVKVGMTLSEVVALY